MSDDGLINVEDDGPEVPATPPPAEPASPPAVEAAVEHPADHPAEVDAVEVGGQKYVPVGALISERKQRQAAEKEAAKVADLESYARDSKPYVEFLKANPGFLAQRQPQPPSGPQPDQPDPQSEQLAKTLDLYTPEGKPDVARAATIRHMMTTTAQQIAQQTIAPIHERTAQEESARNFYVALGYKDPSGRSPRQETLVSLWKSMSPQQTADKNVAAILTATALGMDYSQGKPAIQPPAQPPLISEGPGNTPRRPALSKLEQNIARERGMTEAKWAEHTTGFVSGRAQQLED